MANTWREPVFTLSANEKWLERKILSHDKLKRINIPSTEWAEHCETVDTVLDPILRGIKKYANNYEGLIIHDYVKQGSCREGLKVNDALEFDCLLTFEISGMIIEENRVIDKVGQKILGLVKLKVNNGDYLCRTFPWLKRMGIIEKHYKDAFYFNTKNLQEKVFKSIVDKTSSEINDQLPVGGRSFALRRSANPPTLNLKITVDKELSFIRTMYSLVELQSSTVNETIRRFPTLNIDIVPAIILRLDPDPRPFLVYCEHFVYEWKCPVFAVMKWGKNIRECTRTDDHEYLWRESACGYEKYILDTSISHRNPSQRYLMTACRIVKSYVDWLKENKPQEDQLPRVAVSYYLKNVCFYCIALLTIPDETNSLSSVQEALGYFLCFLGLCIENRNLPHFFYGNPLLLKLLPKCSFSSIGRTKKNLYHSINPFTFIHAGIGFKSMLQDLRGCYIEFNELDLDRVGRFKDLLKKPVRWTGFCSMVFIIISAVVVLVAIFSLGALREI